MAQFSPHKGSIGEAVIKSNLESMHALKVYTLTFLLNQPATLLI